ncbi:hypothetical protein [Streptomyces sp. NPDC002082]|uniref:hypothetical protein n=1 Tax=Streptomyces sp. NPDC002082 TaxID=3154772 RepID=UPI0033345206
MVTMEEQADWAVLALNMYSQAALTGPRTDSREDRVRLGVLAANAVAQETRYLPGDQAVHDRRSADGIIGDLLVYVFCLTHEDIEPAALLQAAEQQRSVPGATGTGADSMVAALLDSAEAYGCDVPGMTETAHNYFQELLYEEDQEDAAEDQ